MLRRSVRTSDDFFLAGRAMPTWVAGLAFMSANLAAQEVIGMGASGAKYGIATCHFYWLVVPAMVFGGLPMMPFYYGSRAHRVPEYLRLRFDEKTRALNAITFALMTMFSSGISMYAMGKFFNLLLGWNCNLCMLVSALIVLSLLENLPAPFTTRCCSFSHRLRTGTSLMDWPEDRWRKEGIEGPAFGACGCAWISSGGLCT